MAFDDPSIRGGAALSAAGPGGSLGDDEPGPSPARDVRARTPWQLAWRRLRRDKATMVMGGVALLAVLIAFLAPVLTAWGVLDPYNFHKDLIDGAGGGLPNAAGGASLAHPFGVEPQTGRDVFSRVMLGVSYSLTIALSASLLTIIVGTIVGIISGFAGGAVDFWISRVIDMILSFPQTLMLIALSAMFVGVLVSFGVPDGAPANGLYIILFLSLFQWPAFARIVRGQVLSLREREFVEAARSLGARNPRIWFKELLPNLWAPILVYFSLYLPQFVSAEAALSFLGVGIKPPTPTLGNVLTSSVVYSTAAPLFFFTPAATIAIIVLAFNLLGDGLRDALDPRASR